ncbi:MAG TPA: hypothetical protein VH619_12750 [Verrucomicrobiae bacterium]|jgi:transposase|nr:hypothetical protein [Verrucomicrobiae bacterium]
MPAFSPDFNPIERLWLRLKADWFWDFIARTPDQLTERLCAALKSLVAEPKNRFYLLSPEMINGNPSRRITTVL